MPGELSPGTTGRRWVPEGGEQKLREKIHRDSKFADDHKNLPFEFSKPVKPKKHDWFECVNCGSVKSAPKNTVMVVCKDCKQASEVRRLSDE